MTIVESIKCVLQQNNDGLTSKQIYDEIIRQGLYSFGAENPVGVVYRSGFSDCLPDKIL